MGDALNKGTIFRWAARVFSPKMARQMEREGSFDLYWDNSRVFTDSDFVRIENRGSDVTIFCFSGLAVLYMGLPSFEFRSILRRRRKDYNLVFFRDLFRMAYHVAPDRSTGGLAYYETKIREIMAELGSKHYVALGSSGGATAALYFATRCGMDQVIGFSPALTQESYISWRSQLRAYFDIKNLIVRPKAYLEVAMIACAAWFVFHRFGKALGKENYWDVVKTYRTAAKRPRATLFYGKYCRPDAQQASLLADLPEVTMIQLETGHHNSPAHLQRRGELGSAIVDTIENARGADAHQTAATPSVQEVP